MDAREIGVDDVARVQAVPRYNSRKWKDEKWE